LNLGLKTCTKANGCQFETKQATLDANWRWVHNTNGYTNCYTGNAWNSQFCPDPETCAKNCALDGVPSSDWNAPYGVHTDGLTLTMDFVTQGQYGKNVGARTYMLDGEQYEMFDLLGREFTFTVDVSNMPCGVNGALYFVAMDKDGNKGNGNECGAEFGTGYCDAQCPHDIKFIDGQANCLDWNSSPTDPNSGTGKWGTCCPEMDIWEANKISTAYTAHPCSVSTQHKCEDPVSCGDNPDHRFDGVCDKDGCDLNPFRAGVKDFFGPGSSYTVDTTKPISVVTQFITDESGDLTEIRRKFIQNGKEHDQPMTKVDSMSKQYDSLTDEMCGDIKTAFGDTNSFASRGGMKGMGESMKNGMVLVMSIWDDHEANMLWLDSTYPTDKTTWGGPRGTCPTTSGVPKDVESQHPNSSVKYGDIRIGEIGTTYTDLVTMNLDTE